MGVYVMKMLLLVICTQILFTCSGLFAKYNLPTGQGNFFDLISGKWIIVFLTMYTIAVLSQLYVLKKITLVKTMSLFVGIDTVLMILAAFFIFNEPLTLADGFSLFCTLGALCLLTKS